jgi:DNA-binding NtrC family response regulator
LQAPVTHIGEPLVPEGFDQSPAILVADGDAQIRRLLDSHLKRGGCRVLLAATKQEAVRIARAQPALDLVVLDLRLPGGTGMSALRALNQACAGAAVIVMMAGASLADSVLALKEGAYDFVNKDASFEDVRLAIRNALQTVGLRQQVETLAARLQEREPDLSDVVWASESMHRVMKLVRKVADSRITVLLEGESGTGKELIARATHFQSAFRHQPFVAVNCAAIPENLLESELFGHAKGAFTGAVARRAGKFEEAHEGTLFLDEIAELSPALQAKLLRVLETGEIQPIGGRARHVNVRIVSATNRLLREAVERGWFRSDLYYRLAVFPMMLPPLRERRKDIPLLIRHFVHKFALHERKKVTGVAAAAEARLLDYPWPGNVRELENMIYRAVVLAETPVLRLQDFALFSPQPPSPPKPEPTQLELPAVGEIPPLEEVEIDAIRKALRATGGNISRATRRLGIARATLYRKFKKHGIPLR